MDDSKAIVKFTELPKKNENSGPEKVASSEIEKFAGSVSIWPSDRAMKKKALAHVQEIHSKKMETEKALILAHMETGALAILEECLNRSEAIKAKVGHQITTATTANMELANLQAQSTSERSASGSYEYKLSIIERCEAGLLPESEANRLIELEKDRAQKLVQASDDITQIFLDGIKSAAKKRFNKLYNDN